jgi:hypothetical protein
VKTENKFVPIYLSQLIPDHNAPCPIFIMFKGRYIPAIREAEAITIEFMAKMFRNKSYFCYIGQEDTPKWEEWFRINRFSYEVDFKNIAADSDRGSSNKAHYISTALKKFTLASTQGEEILLKRKTDKLFRSKVNEALINWYFKYPFDSVILKHSSFVTYLLTSFITFTPGLLSDSEASDLLTAAVIHQLGGDPDEFLTKAFYQEGLDFLQRKQISLPQTVIDLITNQNELYSGKGRPGAMKGDEMPITLKILSLVDSFCHYHAVSTELTTGSITDGTMKLLAERKEDFDQTIVDCFQQFLSKVTINIKT